MGNTKNAVDVCLLTIGSLYSLANIEEILGIVILVIQVGWIITKLVCKIISAVKSKKGLSTLEPDVDSVIETILNVKDSLKHSEETDKNDRSKPEE